MGFKEYFIQRVLNTIFIIFVAVVLQFFLFRILPGNPIAFLINANMPIQARQAMIRLWGLDRPLHEQFVTYIVNIFSGKLGISFISQRPVIDEILERLPNTLLLTGSATIIYIVVGVVVGVIAASRRGSRLDIFSMGIGLLTQALPTFFLGLLLLFVFGYYLPLATNNLIIFPIAGTISRPPPINPSAYFVDLLWHLTLPLVTLVIINFGGYTLIVRNLMADALAQDYILMAKARGLRGRTVLYKHGFRSIFPPIVTMVGLSLSGVIGGAVITETIFSWHGIGRYLYDAILQYDYPVMQGTFFLIALVTIISNLLVDLIYGFLDPRIKY